MIVRARPALAVRHGALADSRPFDDASVLAELAAVPVAADDDAGGASERTHGAEPATDAAPAAAPAASVQRTRHRALAMLTGRSARGSAGSAAAVAAPAASPPSRVRVEHTTRGGVRGGAYTAVTHVRGGCAPIASQHDVRARFVVHSEHGDDRTSRHFVLDVDFAWRAEAAHAAATTHADVRALLLARQRQRRYYYAHEACVLRAPARVDARWRRASFVDVVAAAFAPLHRAHQPDDGPPLDFCQPFSIALLLVSIDGDSRRRSDGATRSDSLTIDCSVGIDDVNVVLADCGGGLVADGGDDSDSEAARGGKAGPPPPVAVADSQATAMALAEATARADAAVAAATQAAAELARVGAVAQERDAKQALEQRVRALQHALGVAHAECAQSQQAAATYQQQLQQAHHSLKIVTQRLSSEISNVVELRAELAALRNAPHNTPPTRATAHAVAAPTSAMADAIGGGGGTPPAAMSVERGGALPQHASVTPPTAATGMVRAESGMRPLLADVHLFDSYIDDQ